MMNRRARIRHRAAGIAMITALALLTLVAITLVPLTALTRAQVRYTRHVADEAQLRQMLLAGEQAARATLAQAPEPPARQQAVPLPSGLAEAGATLTLGFEELEDDRWRVRVRAALGEDHAQQTLRYRREDQRWQLERTRLGRMR